MPEKKKSYILSDLFESVLSPILFSKPVFCLPDGIFSPLDRLLSKGEKIDHLNVLTNRERAFFDPFLENRSVMNWSVQQKDHVQNLPLQPSHLTTQFEEKFDRDLRLLEKKKFLNLKKPAFFFEGDINNVLIHPTAEVSASACLDVGAGTILIEKNVKIGAFSYLKGPLFVGESSIVNRGNISSSRIGKHCRIGGEIAHCLIGNYANKSHEGFLGHSIVGDWVNLGALTTTSDLKNNYSQVRLQYKEKTYETKEQKFGSIIGDFARTGIGTMLNTGSILDMGACLFEGRPLQKYYPAFFWGGKPNKYKLDRFLSDLSVIMARREKVLSKHTIEMLRKRYLV